MKPILTLLFSLFVFLIGNAQSSFKTQSILQKGTFFKAAIPKSGVYTIDNTNLNKLTGGKYSDIRSVKIYSQPGSALSESTDSLPVDDLLEIPSLLLDDATIAFYAEGARTLEYDNNTSSYSLVHNPYSVNNYIFIQVDGTNPKRIGSSNQPDVAEYTSSSFDHVQRYEEDHINLLHTADIHFGTGREWFMERMDKKKALDAKFDFSHTIKGSPYEVQARGAYRCNRQGKLVVEINDDTYSKSVGSVYTTSSDAPYARTSVIHQKGTLKNDTKSIKMYTESTDPNCPAWLDYLQITTRDDAVLDESQRLFTDHKSLEHRTAQLTLRGAGSRILEVSKLDDVQEYIPSNNVIRYSVDNRLRRFATFQKSNLIPITNATRVENQNLHGLYTTEMVVLYHSKFEEAATQLAQHRSKHNNIMVSAIDIQKVYNEYSGGRVDPTAIRNFVRMLWLRDKSMKYLLLFGDATFDYRHIIQSLPYDNYIPAYETEKGLHPISTFPSDDYYAGLENPHGGLSMKSLQISVGRLPVTDINNAKALADKIIHYDTNKNRYGSWRSHITFVADDEDGNSHMRSADKIANKVYNEKNVFNQNKIYFDAYKQESTPGGDRYFKASEDINRKVQNGQLIVCYFGHGGPSGWAQERVLKKSDIDTWTNYDNMPLLITATCTFAGYDDPSKVSAGEYCLQKEDGGAIALMTTVRPVYGSSNENLTRAVFDTLLGTTINGKMTFGDVMKYAKNKLNGTSNSKRFTLLGDPSQRIAAPEYSIYVDKVNDKKTQTVSDTISAFEKVEISGHIQNDSGAIFSEFNGILDMTLYDKKSDLVTLANDRSAPFSFSTYKNIIFRGRTDVKDGKYTVSFVVPKDINYEVGRGRISTYAFSESYDAIGQSDSIYVGGTADDPIQDDVGPSVRVYMDNRSFVDGSLVSRYPVLIADFQDDVGINVTGSSIGHDITAIFNDDVKTTLILNDYYTAALNDYTKGSLAIPIHHLEPGTHSVTVKAWDTANNSGQKTIRFIIPDRSKATISCTASPNPFVESLNFKIKQNLYLDYEVQLIMMDATGRLVYQKRYDNVINNSIFLDANELMSIGIENNMLLYKIILSNNKFNSFIESPWEKLIKL